MKILWVNPSFLDYRVAVYKRLNDLTKGNFYIIFSHNRVPQRVINKIKCAIGDNALVLKKEKQLIIGENEGMSNKWIHIPFTIGLYKKIKSCKADIIISEGFFQWTPQAIRYAVTYKKPLLIAYERTKHTERNCPKWRTLYRKMVDHFTSGYLCNGILTQQYLEELGVNPKKIFIGGMSADSEDLVKKISEIDETECNFLVRKLRLNKGITYLYVGQIIERKGLIYLLKAWKHHILCYPDDNLLIVGGGNLYDTFLNDFGKNRGIYFLGNVDYNDIYKYYAIGDVFIIPTLEDNWSLVVPEAMACGLPIACSIYNGCYPELVKQNINGSLFDPLREESIIDVLKYFHKVNLKEFGEKSKDIERKYNCENVSNRILQACLKIYNRQ